MQRSTESFLTFRVLLVMQDQWPRALLRAELLAAGYDAVGVRSLEEAADQPVALPGRGPIRLLIADNRTHGDDAAALEATRVALGGPDLFLVAAAGAATPAIGGSTILRRPVSLGEIVAEVQRRWPLATGGAGSI